MSSAIQIGLETACECPEQFDFGDRFALLMNQASVDVQLRYSCDVLAKAFPQRLAVILSPQHGLWGEQQANMVESPHGRYEPLDVPVYSLYGQTRWPTREMLRDVDCLVVDLQDVGTRVYTFAWTVMYCLEACAELGIPVRILDRPNPLGGRTVEGPLLQEGFQSFVGRACIPMRHGLTLGELARMLCREHKIATDLSVIPLQGWNRDQLWNELGRFWIAPSPNLPRFESALLYPGQVLLEGTNLSEGRGTTMPFELIGAPFLSSSLLLEREQDFDSPGLALMASRFLPTFDKWQGKSCEGIASRVRDPKRVRSFEWTVRMLGHIAQLWPMDFQWLPPPYEYETVRMPIDILYGSSDLRQTIDQAAESEALSRSMDVLCKIDEQAWWSRVGSDLLY